MVSYADRLNVQIAYKELEIEEANTRVEASKTPKTATENKCIFFWSELKEQFMQELKALKNTKAVRVLKFKEKNLVHNIEIAHKNQCEVAGEYMFARGKWFYIPFYETYTIYEMGFIGKWIEKHGEIKCIKEN